MSKPTFLLILKIWSFIKKRKLLFAVLFFILLAAIAAFFVKSEIGARQSKHNQLLRDYKYELFSLILESQENSNESEYLQALVGAKSVFDALDKWKGIDKKAKQKAWFNLEDIRAFSERCYSDQACASKFGDTTKAILRSAETRIKAFEAASISDVQEHNNLQILADTLSNEALDSMYSEGKETIKFTENQLNDLLASSWEATFVDLVQLKHICDNIGDEFKSSARYKQNCDRDFFMEMFNFNFTGKEDYLAGWPFSTYCILEVLNSEEPECPKTIKAAFDVRQRYIKYLENHDNPYYSTKK